jgi:indole-3-glycerol phosphate synthase
MQFVATQKRGIALVPRLKRVDPRSGRQWPSIDLLALARAADDSEAGAIAVCTAQLFGGEMEDLNAAAAAVTAPLLRDDLCIDERQVYDARLRGADAIVVPAGDMPVEKVRVMADVAASVHMATVIEVCREADLAAALAIPHACIGVNCSAPDGCVAVAQALALAKQLPPSRVVLLLAEVRDLDEAWSMRGSIDAAVVGDVLLDAADLAEVIGEFTGRGS